MTDWQNIAVIGIGISSSDSASAGLYGLSDIERMSDVRVARKPNVRIASPGTRTRGVVPKNSAVIFLPITALFYSPKKSKSHLYWQVNTFQCIPYPTAVYLHLATSFIIWPLPKPSLKRVELPAPKNIKLYNDCSQIPAGTLGPAGRYPMPNSTRTLSRADFRLFLEAYRSIPGQPKSGY